MSPTPPSGQDLKSKSYTDVERRAHPVGNPGGKGSDPLAVHGSAIMRCRNVRVSPRLLTHLQMARMIGHALVVEIR